MTINPQLDNIPPELRQHKAWLVWRYEANKDPDKKPLKVPYYAITGRRRAGAQGSAADRAELVSFEEAVSVFRNRRGYYTGIGFATLAEWGVVGLDFDNCVSEDGAVDSRVLEVVGTTYSEVSPSGRGVRAFVMGRLPDRKSVGATAGSVEGEKGFGFETFHTKGFLTVTGAVTDVYGLAGVGVEALDVGVGELYESRFGSARLAWQAEQARAVRLAAAGEAGVGGTGGAGTGLQSVLDLGVLTSALRTIADAVNAGKQEMGRNTWRDVLFGIGEATGWSAEGWEVAHEFSKAVPDYGPEALDEIWEGGARKAAAGVGAVGDDVGGARITDATVRHMARKWGWVDPTLAPDDGAFDVVPFDTQPVPQVDGADGAPAGGEVALADAGLPLEPPVFDRKKSGAILPIFENALKAIERPDVVGWGARCDTFRDEVMVLPPGSTEWRAWRANDVGELRVVLKGCGFESCGKEIVRDALVQAAGRREYDSAQQWLGGLEGRWDGVPRCETFLIDFWGAADTAYTRAVGRYMWTALAGRVITPGCQADMVPIFEGHQGLRKTSGLAALVPDYTLFTEVDLTSKDADLARAMKGVLVCEISELRGLHTRDQESIKAFVTRRYEKWVPKFVEQATSYKRRSVLFGTTNRTDILADETGNRRWLPLHVERVDVEGIEGARDQLWAEAAALYRAGGVDWHGAETLATVEHEAFMWTDSWEEAIAKWLEDDDEEGQVAPSGGHKNRSGTVQVAPFTTAEVLTRALGILQKDANMGQQRRVGAVLRKMGFEKQKKQVAGVRTLYWIKQKA